MNYINTLELITALTQGTHIDAQKMLATADREKIFRKINKLKTGLLIYENFKITQEPVEEANWAKLPEKDKERLTKIYRQIRKNNTKGLAELIEFKRIYPNVPAICNYLSLAYQVTKQTEKYKAILQETIELFPDYLFGKTALAEYYLSHGEFAKIPALLDHKYGITQHFPAGTDVFHISAVRSLYFVTGRYFAKAGEIEMAYKSYFLLFDMDKNHPMTIKLAQDILLYEAGLLMKDFEKRAGNNPYK